MGAGTNKYLDLDYQLFRFVFIVFLLLCLEPISVFNFKCALLDFALGN